MAELKNYDVYLNGKGYMLARDNRGNLLSGAYAEKHSDPFMRYVSTESRWAEVTFRFSDGAGAEKFDGSNRYRWGKNIDTRSGNLLRGPQFTRVHSQLINKRPVADDTIAGLEISNAVGANDGYALRFEAALTSTIDTVAVLVKRKADRDYNGAGNFTVGIYADAAGPVPGAAVGSQGRGFTYVDFDAARMYGCQPWENDEYFWVFASVSAAVVAGTYYWVGIINNQAYEVYWAGASNDTTQTQAKYDGANWAAHANTGNFCFVTGWRNYLDRPVTDMLSFRGGDGINRIYATSGNKILSKTDAATAWTVARNPYTALIQDIGVYNGLLYTAIGLGADMEQFTGTTTTTTWTAILNQRAIRFANHDGLFWKVGGVSGATGVSLLSGYDGSTWGATFQVGDPGTAITAMVSHGGKLYCAKEEGIYEINYEDTYPTSGSVTANLVLDFSTDCALRPWILDWHGGLYFPGNNAVYEWKNGVLRDIWNDRIDPEVQEVTGTQAAEIPAFTTRRRNAPISTVDSGERGVFQAAIGTTRGLFVTLASPHLYEGQIWCYNLSGWHPLGPVSAKSGEDPLTAAFLAEYLSALHMRSLGPSEDRLYFTNGQAVCYFRLPGWTSDASQYENSAYQPAWEVELPLFDADDPKIKKYFHSVEVVTKNIASNPCVIVDVQVDVGSNDEDWYLKRILTDGPTGEVELGTVGQNIRIRLQGRYSDSTSVDLIIESVTLKYHMLPDTVTTYSMLVEGSANQGKIGGGVDTRTAATINSELKALAELEEPWVFTNPILEREFVMLLGLDTRLKEIKDRAGQMGPPVELIHAISLIKMKAIAELLENGHFEANIDGWTAFQRTAAWSATEGYPLEGSLTWAGTSLGIGGLIYQDLMIPSPGIYSLSLWAKCDTRTYTLTAGVAYTTDVPIDSFSVAITAVDTWQYFQGNLDLPSGILRVYVSDPGGGIGAPWNFYLDAISLIAA